MKQELISFAINHANQDRLNLIEYGHQKFNELGRGIVLFSFDWSGTQDYGIEMDYQPIQAAAKGDSELPFIAVDNDNDIQSRLMSYEPDNEVMIAYLFQQQELVVLISVSDVVKVLSYIFGGTQPPI